MPERDLTEEWLKQQLAKYENKPTDSHTWGRVVSIDDNGRLSVLLNHSGTPCQCMPFEDASVGDIVMVCITANGDAAVIARLSKDDVRFSKPVYFGNRVYFDYGSYIYGTSPSGEILALLNLQSSSGNLALGYDMYAKGSGNTNIYGNGINLYTNGNTIGANKPVRQHLYQVSSSGNSSRTLSTSYATVACSTDYYDLSDHVTPGTSGITVSKSGHVLLFGSIHCTGLTAGDVVAGRFARTSSGTTSGFFARNIGATKTTITIPLATSMWLNSGDSVFIQAANLTAARGTVGGTSASNILLVWAS